MSAKPESGNISSNAFEAWRKEQINSLIRSGYPDAAKAFRDLGSVQWAGWMAAWKASREAIEVELPAERKIRHLPRLDENTAYNEAIENCRDAIEAAGLKVKP